jgi:hypothetical protein
MGLVPVGAPDDLVDAFVESAWGPDRFVSVVDGLVISDDGQTVVRRRRIERRLVWLEHAS